VTLCVVNAACLYFATKRGIFERVARLDGVQTRSYLQSVIGAMEQRRESGAAVAEIGGIGGTNRRGREVGALIRNGENEVYSHP
jgi:hypothetical protein